MKFNPLTHKNTVQASDFSRKIEMPKGEVIYLFRSNDRPYTINVEEGTFCPYPKEVAPKIIERSLNTFPGQEFKYRNGKYKVEEIPQEILDLETLELPRVDPLATITITAPKRNNPVSCRHPRAKEYEGFETYEAHVLLAFETANGNKYVVCDVEIPKEYGEDGPRDLTCGTALQVVDESCITSRGRSRFYPLDRLRGIKIGEVAQQRSDQFRRIGLGDLPFGDGATIFQDTTPTAYENQKNIPDLPSEVVLQYNYQYRKLRREGDIEGCRELLAKTVETMRTNLEAMEGALAAFPKKKKKRKSKKAA